jgi:AraC-like DNA-binding protein
MKLVQDPNKIGEGGRILSIPQSLKKYIVPWAMAEYREYDFGYILTQEWVDPKFSVFMWRLNIQKPVKLYPATNKPTISLFCTLEGNIRFILSGFGEKLLGPFRMEMLYIPGTLNEATFEPGRYQSLHIEMDSEFLEDALPVHPFIQKLLDGLTKSNELGIALDPVNIGYVTLAILERMRNSSEEVGGLRLEMKDLIQELLVEYIHESEERKRILGLGDNPYKKTIIAIRDYILHAPHIHDYPIAGLAREFGISQTAVKANFKIFFGLPLGKFIRFHALAKARYLIASSDRSIDGIAFDVGYPSRSNFDKAFKRQYDCKATQARNFLAKSLPKNPDQIH